MCTYTMCGVVCVQMNPLIQLHIDSCTHVYMYKCTHVSPVPKVDMSMLKLFGVDKTIYIN